MVEQTRSAAAGTHIIKRPRLTQLIDNAASRVDVILLVAPAGYGKTTLAREWLCGRRYTWYRGGPASGDAASLAVGLADAAASIVPGAGRRMRDRLHVTDAPERDVDVLVDLFTEDLHEWPNDAWLVFDDYQFAMTSEVTERFIAELTNRAPVRLLLTSRRRPAWVNARRLLYGEIVELGRSILGMSEAEGAAVLASRPAGEIRGLLTLADGWPAVLGLAAVAGELQLHDDDLPDELYEFFAEELFQGLVADRQRQFCRLTFAPTLTRDLAAILFGSNAAEVIDEATRLGLLTQQPGGAFDLHPLLRDFLDRKLRTLVSESEAEIVEQVTCYLIAREAWDDAFSLIQRYPSSELVVTLIQKGMASILAEGRLATLHRWLLFASDLRIVSPILHLAEAEIAFREGAHDKAESLAREASREFGERHALVSRALSLAGESAYQRDRCVSSLKLHQRALSLARAPEDARRAAWGQFLTAVQLESDAADTFLQDVAQTHGASVDSTLRLATARLLLAATRDGTVEIAESMWPMLHLVARSRDAKIRTSFLYLFGSILASTARYAEALEMVNRAKRDAQAYRLDFTLPFSLLVETTAQIGLREFSEATRLIDECVSLATRNRDVFLDMSIRAAKAKMLLAHGAFEDAAHAVKHEWEHVPGPVLYGELLGVRALTQACLNDVDRALTTAEQAEITTRGVEARTLAACSRAVVLLTTDADAARIRGLLSIAGATGNFDSLVVTLRARPQLIAYAQDIEQLRLPLIEILTRSRDERLARDAGLAIERARPRQSVLSPREQEVFTLILQGQTNREIAQALVLSEATVKVHVRHILRKLGARSRTEAVLKRQI